MRLSLLAGLLLLVPAVASAEPGPYLAVVSDPEVKLRAGPSDQFPETGNLPRGATVLVDHEEPNGWLAVQDPPGKIYSLSWVQMQFVNFDTTRPTPQNVEVTEDTTLAAGQMGLAQPMTHVRRAKVPAGTILTVVGAKVKFEDRTWYPVVPPSGDFRFLPRQAVKFDRAAATFAVRDVSPPPAGGALPVAAIGGPTGPAQPSATGPGTTVARPAEPTPGPTPTSKPTVQHPLWAQADIAERDGRYDDADKLLFQLARVMNEPGGDHDIANLCYTRIHTLREKQRAGVPGTTTAAAATVATRPALGQPTRPAGGLPPVIGSPPGSAAGDPLREDRPRWSGPGKLVRSALTLDGRKCYALEAYPGVPLVYVVAAPGVDLERYLGRKVDVYGLQNNRRDLTKPYVVATAVEPGS